MSPASSDRLCAQAQSLLDVGRSHDALPLLQQAIAADPEALDPRCLLALALYRLSRNSEALQAAGEAASLHPDEEWPHRLRSVILLELKKPREALAAATEAVRLAPELPEAVHCLSNCELENGHKAEARRWADYLLSLAPDRAMSHRMIGAVALRECRWREAEGHYRKALELDPESGETMNAFGVALLNQGKKKAAIEAFHQAARLNPSLELPRKNLYQAVKGYISGGAVLFIIAAQILRAGEGVTRTLPPQVQAAVYAGLALVIIGGAAGYGVWSRRRMEELHPTVKTYYHQELRKRSGETVRALLIVLALIAGSMTTLLWTFFWLTEGAAAAGLQSWPLAAYLGIAGGTIAGFAVLMREAWTRRARRKA